MLIILAPDKFKGNLSSFEICAALREGILSGYPSAEVIDAPMADGGDGFAEIIHYYKKTTPISVETVDALQRKISTSYQWNPSTNTAVIELASASGLGRLNLNERNPLLTNTYGTGLIIKDAINNGAVEIILGIGGSATNDAGAGILAALGFIFLDDKQHSIFPSGGNLISIKEIQVPGSIPNVRFQIATDVTNPLYGANGAAYIYGRQKGADSKMIESLDAGLKNFAAIIFKQTGIDVATAAGFGAAGGAACGLSGFFDTTLRPGIEIVIEASELLQQIHRADLIITGEGSIDEQSAQGKVISAIASTAKQHSIPCFAVCGRSSLNSTELEKIGIKALLTLADLAKDEKQSFTESFSLLSKNISGLISRNF